MFSGCCHTAVGTAGSGPCPLGISAFQCFWVSFGTVVFNIFMCFRKYSMYGDTDYSFKKVFLWKKKNFRSLKFSEVFVRAALHAGRCAGLCSTAFGQLYLKLSLSLSMTVVLTEAK